MRLATRAGLAAPRSASARSAPRSGCTWSARTSSSAVSRSSPRCGTTRCSSGSGCSAIARWWSRPAARAREHARNLADRARRAAVSARALVVGIGADPAAVRARRRPRRAGGGALHAREGAPPGHGRGRAAATPPAAPRARSRAPRRAATASSRWSTTTSTSASRSAAPAPKSSSSGRRARDGRPAGPNAARARRPRISEDRTLQTGMNATHISEMSRSAQLGITPRADRCTSPRRGGKRSVASPTAPGQPPCRARSARAP